MTTTHVPEPELPDGITPGELDAEARRDLRGLQKDTADVVAKHLVAAGMLVDEDPERALEHARYARRRASRIAVVREAAGIAAYHAGEWNEALGELRAARRMGGGPGHLAVMADIERALGRPERALELVRAPEAKELGRAETIELAIVAAGARRDLGELEAAVVGLQIAELEPTRRDPWSPRLFYAYADNLLAAGRESDALQWFVHAVDADALGETDAAERIAELTGEPIDDDGVVFQGEDEVDLATPGDEELTELDDSAGVAEQSVDAQAVPEIADVPDSAVDAAAVDAAAGGDAVDPDSFDTAAGVDAAGVDTVDESAEADMAGVDAVEVDAADADAAGVDAVDESADVDVAGVDAVEVDAADADAVGEGSVGGGSAGVDAVDAAAGVHAADAGSVDAGSAGLDADAGEVDAAGVAAGPDADGPGPSVEPVVGDTDASETGEPDR